jgi:hypothetical protein
MYPVSYDKCPKCRATEAKQTQYKPKKRIEEIVDEAISVMVVGSEVSQGDADYQF